MAARTQVFDIAVLGSGFAGSLLAMVARRLGYSVLLLERGRHPRFAIGESSTPLANLLLEELAHRYDLPQLLPLTRWGTWRREHPELACGLKRGFTFYHHAPGGAAPDGELLVAASPHDAIADTHWYREELDAYLVEQAQALGAAYVDAFEIEQLDEARVLAGVREGVPKAYQARLLVDATGPRGALHRLLRLREAALPGMPATEMLFSHFRGVERFVPGAALDVMPYPADDAAVHHVFDNGWMWVLRFGNGVTSAGVAMRQQGARSLQLEQGDAAWQRVLSQMPGVAGGFAHAQPLRPLTHLARPGFLAASAAGENWALLPSAAAFVDPLLSTGIVLTLLGVERLCALLEDRSGATWPRAFGTYAEQTHAEACATARLVGALYATMRNFEAFTALTLVYFVAASFAESARRLGRAELAPGFLLCGHDAFSSAMQRLCARAPGLHAGADTRGFVNDVLRAIEPFDVAGLTDTSRGTRYPVRTQDLLQNAHKLGANTEEVRTMLARCGLTS